MRYEDPLDHGDGFYAWQPSTWPDSPETYNEGLGKALERIFNDSLLLEINNVIQDARPNLEHRGHVVALAILCAIDTLSSYAFRDVNRDICLSCRRTDQVGPRYEKYIKTFFPLEYKPFARKIYKLYRNQITHSWNLFEAGMLPGDKPITEQNGTIVFGLINFFNALEESVVSFLTELKVNNSLQNSVLLRYRELKQMARP